MRSSVFTNINLAQTALVFVATSQHQLFKVLEKHKKYWNTNFKLVVWGGRELEVNGAIQLFHHLPNQTA